MGSFQRPPGVLGAGHNAGRVDDCGAGFLHEFGVDRNGDVLDKYMQTLFGAEYRITVFFAVVDDIVAQLPQFCPLLFLIGRERDERTNTFQVGVCAGQQILMFGTAIEGRD